MINDTPTSLFDTSRPGILDTPKEPKLLEEAEVYTATYQATQDDIREALAKVLSYQSSMAVLKFIGTELDGRKKLVLYLEDVEFPEMAMCDVSYKGNREPRIKVQGE